MWLIDEDIEENSYDHPVGSELIFDTEGRCFVLGKDGIIDTQAGFKTFAYDVSY